MAARDRELSVGTMVLGVGGRILHAQHPRNDGALRAIFWGYIVFLGLMQAYANFGPAPASPAAMASMALGFYVVLALLAAVVERTAMRG